MPGRSRLRQRRPLNPLHPLKRRSGQDAIGYGGQEGSRDRENRDSSDAQDQKEKASYALGMNIGRDLRRKGVIGSVDPALTARGLKDSLSGSKALLTDDEQKAALMQLQTDVWRSSRRWHARRGGLRAKQARPSWPRTRAKKES